MDHAQDGPEPRQRVGARQLLERGPGVARCRAPERDVASWIADHLTEAPSVSFTDAAAVLVREYARRGGVLDAGRLRVEVSAALVARAALVIYASPLHRAMSEEYLGAAARTLVIPPAGVPQLPEVPITTDAVAFVGGDVEVAADDAGALRRAHLGDEARHVGELPLPHELRGPVLARLESYAERFGDRFKPAALLRDMASSGRRFRK